MGRPVVLGIAGSPNAAAAELMLARAGLPARRLDLPPGVHQELLRAAGFAAGTVPAVVLPGGRRVQGTVALAGLLGLLPPGGPARDAVAWVEEELQELPRRLVMWALLRDPAAAATFRGPRARRSAAAGALAAPLLALQARRTGVDAPAAGAARAALPAALDHVDALLAAGVLGHEPPHAGDLLAAPQLRALMALDDLRPAIDARPAGAFALRTCPHFPGHVPAGALPRRSSW